MSFLFGSTKNLRPEEPRPFGAQTERIATNEGARVLPWFVGTRWLGVTWMGDVFDVKTTSIKRKVGKKKTTVGYNYYASFVGLVCAGPVDRIMKIKFDDKVVWEGEAIRSDEDSITLTTDVGNFVVYWGTETQTMDAELASADSEHSPYRGQCYIVARQVLLGADRTTVPNLQLKLVRDVKSNSVVNEAHRISTPGGLATGPARNANPISVLIEWWTDKRFGMVRDESELDAERLALAAAGLWTEGLGVSPLLTQADDGKRLLTQLLEHIDGFPTSYGGKLGVQLIRPGRTTVPTITASHLIGDYTLQSEGWPDTYDEVRVKFKNDKLDGGDDSVKHHEMANFAATGRHRALNVDRPWVIQDFVASLIAGSIGRVVGTPQATGSMEVRESVASDLTVGGVFDLTTRDGLTMRMRVTERQEPKPPKRGVSISFKSDTGWANDTFYSPAADAIVATPLFAPEEPYAIRIFDSPYAFAPQELAALLHFVARGDTVSTAYDVWRASSEEGSYKSATEHRPFFSAFAIKAQLSGEYSGDTLPVDDIAGITFEVLSPDATLLEDEWDFIAGTDHELLCFFGSAATEIASLFDVEKTGATTYTAKCIRGLYDTRRRTHADGTEIWLQLRTKMDADPWPPFSEDARFYKHQPNFLGSEIDLSDLTAISHTENARTLLPIAPSNVLVNGDGVHPTWTTGNDITLSWWNTSRERTVFGLPFADAPATDLTGMSFEFWVSDSLVATVDEDAADETATVTDAYLVANVNDDFTLRAYGVRNGKRSLDYTEVFVEKV